MNSLLSSSDQAKLIREGEARVLFSGLFGIGGVLLVLFGTACENHVCLPFEVELFAAEQFSFSKKVLLIDLFKHQKHFVLGA